MKIRYILLMTLLVLIWNASYSFGSVVPDLKSFTSGTPALASDVNKNFSDVKTAVDDNAGDISTNAGRISDNEGNIGTNSGRISDNEGNIGTNAGRISDNEGNIGTNAGRISDNEGNIRTNNDTIDELLDRITILEELVRPIKVGFNIDFGTNNEIPPKTYGAASNQTGYWTKTGLGQSLLPSTNIRPAYIEVSAGSNSSSTDSIGTNSASLMKDGFTAGFENTWQVTIGPITNGNYDLYVYALFNSVTTTLTGDFNITLTSYFSTGDMEINGDQVDGISGIDSDSALMESGRSYIVVPVNITGNTLTITGLDPSDASSFKGLAGLQLVPREE